MFPSPRTPSRTASSVVTSPAAFGLGEAHASVVHLQVEAAPGETAGATFLRAAARAREMLQGLAGAGPARIVFLLPGNDVGCCPDLTRSLTVFAEHANRRYASRGLRFAVESTPARIFAN